MALTRLSLLGAVLIMLLAALIIGALPRWAYSRSWGYGPFAVAMLFAATLVVLMLVGEA